MGYTICILYRYHRAQTYRKLFSRTTAESDSKNALRRLRALVKVRILFIFYDVSGCLSCVDRWSDRRGACYDLCRREKSSRSEPDEQCSAYDEISGHVTKVCSQPRRNQNCGRAAAVVVSRHR